MDTPLIPDTGMPETNWLLRAWSSRPWPWGGAAASSGATTMDASPATISSDLVFHLAEFVGDKQFIFFALVSKDWRTAWGRRPTLTSWATPYTTVSQLRYSLECGVLEAEVRFAKRGPLFSSLARSGNLELLKLAHKNRRHKNRSHVLHFSTCEVAAGCGHLEVLQWATKQLGVRESCHACSAAAKGGHMDVLQWAIDIGYAWSKTKTCSSAAEGGHLEVLQWLREKGCPWDEGTCTSAAMGGHLTTLTWARAHGCPWNARTSAAAAKSSPHVLRWARENGCPWDAETCTNLAEVGDLATLRWARESDCPWNEETCRMAARGGHLEVLSWARALGCPWYPYTCAEAAPGNPHVLRWARDNGCPWDAETCMKLAKVGDLATLRWARARGCPWGPAVFRAAAQGGHVQVLQYARDAGCPDVTFGQHPFVFRWEDVRRFLCRNAAAGGHLEALQWARANGYEWCGEECTAAAEGGHLEVLRWARENGCPWSHHTIRVAAHGGHSEVLRWARENGCPLPPDPPKAKCCHCPDFRVCPNVYEPNDICPSRPKLSNCVFKLWLCLYCSFLIIPSKLIIWLSERICSCFRSLHDFRGRGNHVRSMC